ncbi:MAG: beta-N-acetylhexosaminidase [Deltaproteobacteria bacterium]|nr:beta-N-acetylhexosaminidase [Deltaproteobacteria bacterium]
MTDPPGQLLFAGFEGTRVPDDLAALVAAGRMGGVVLFSRNVENADQLRTLVRELHAPAPEEFPLLLAIDQEGGRVQRLRAPWTVWPPMRALGDRDDPALSRALAIAIAQELLDVGIGLDFAPVVDVATEPSNPVIGDRSFGETPQRVARHARAFVEGLQSAGVAACAKHFPGHGDTTCDSHLELPRLAHDLERLRSVELPPFRAAIEAGVAAVMTAHVLFPALDPVRPATLSPAVLRILREELGFSGVVFSDDLEMRAVVDAFSTRDCVLGALRAGVDALLVCSDRKRWSEALATLESAPAPLLAAPLQHVRALKDRFAHAARARAFSNAAPPYTAHQELARGIAPSVA